MLVARVMAGHWAEGGATEELMQAQTVGQKVVEVVVQEVMGEGSARAGAPLGHLLVRMGERSVVVESVGGMVEQAGLLAVWEGTEEVAAEAIVGQEGLGAAEAAEGQALGCTAELLEVVGRKVVRDSLGVGDKEAVRVAGEVRAVY